MSQHYWFKANYKLRVVLTHLQSHKSKHIFEIHYILFATVETTIHYLLHCANFWNEKLTLFNKRQSIDENILSKDGSNISKVLIFGDHTFNDAKNTSVLTVSIE